MEVEKIQENDDGSETIFFEMSEEEVEIWNKAVKDKKPFIIGDKKYQIIPPKKKGEDFTLKLIKTKKTKKTKDKKNESKKKKRS